MLTAAQIDPDTRPSNIAPPFTGHFKVTADTPRGLQPHQPAPNSTVSVGRPYPQTDRLAGAATPSQADLNLKIRRNIYEPSGKQVTPTKQEDGASNGHANGEDENLESSLKQDGKQYFCYTCGKDCSRVRYHNSKAPPAAATGKNGAMAKYDLCAYCYLDGRFPSSSGPGDYAKIENERYTSIADREAPWADGELLLLLEGLEMYDENWDSVAEHVGSRTREECVLKFLQLEIEDKYLEGEPEVEGGAPTNLAYLSNGRIPFSQADNPVMSVMSFLAGLADPAVTAAAAGKTVESMKKSIRGQLEKDSSAAAEDPASKEKGSSATAEPVKDENTMDLDTIDPKSESTSTPATVALSLTAARSAALASHTERHITSLISGAVNLQMQKLELKLQQFAEMETLLQAERRELERQRQRLFLDRLQFKKRVRETEERFRRLGVDPGIEKENDEGEKLVVAEEGEQSSLEVKPVATDAPGYKMHEI